MAPNKRSRRSMKAKKRAVLKKAKKDADSSSWLEAVENHVRETQTSTLNLAGWAVGMREVQSVLKSLQDSQVTDFSLNFYKCIKNGMAVIAPLLKKTKIKKLKYLRFSNTTKKDLLRLLEVLKESHITDLSVLLSQDFQLNFNEARKCISYLQSSKLITLTADLFRCFPSVGLASFIKDYLDTSITCLNLQGTKLNSNDFTTLFTNLGHSSVTYLDLSSTGISSEALQELSQRLVETKIEKLNLDLNSLQNEQLNILISGLISSKVTDLDLSHNRLSSLSPLFIKLKETQIKTLDLSSNIDLKNNMLVYADCLQCSLLTSLDLSYCCLSDQDGETLMVSLRFSSVTKLDIAHNFMGLLSMKKFAENIKDINLTDLDISFNPLSLDAFFILGKCLKESKLTHIKVNHIKSEPPLEAHHLLSFLMCTEGSSICHIDMESSYSSRWGHRPPPVGELKLLMNTTLTELNLRRNCIMNNVLNLISYLKFTAVTYLDLSNNYVLFYDARILAENLKFTAVTRLDLCDNNVTDELARVLAENLSGTQIRRLYLNFNFITSQGAKALALSLKETNLLFLHLNRNKIEEDGLEYLAENAKDTFISEISVFGNPGKRVFLVDRVLWQNKISVHKLVSIFKQIEPQTNNDEFCFDPNYDDLDVSAFLENCMWFYKTIIDNPRVVNVLLEEKSVSFSREQLFRLVFEEFPRQYSAFIACRVEANVTEHVRILVKAEEMGLTAIVESLLLNRPVYMFDKVQGILHPQVYKLLLKYKQPVCNLDIEPHGVVKIIEYFIEHADVEGAQDLINLLRDAKIS